MCMAFMPREYQNVVFITLQRYDHTEIYLKYYPPPHTHTLPAPPVTTRTTPHPHTPGGN